MNKKKNRFENVRTEKNYKRRNGIIVEEVGVVNLNEENCTNLKTLTKGIKATKQITF